MRSIRSSLFLLVKAPAPPLARGARPPPAPRRSASALCPLHPPAGGSARAAGKGAFSGAVKRSVRALLGPELRALGDVLIPGRGRVAIVDGNHADAVGH